MPIPILSRMIHGRTIGLLAAVALAIAVFGGCGSDNGGGKRLSRSTASQLTATLDRVEQDVNAGNCEAAATQTRALVERTGSLPGNTNADLRAALVEGADRLQALVTERCAAATTGPTGTTQTETTPQSGSSGPTGEENPGKQEKQKGPKKETTKGPKGPKHEQSGTEGQSQTPTTGGDGQDNLGSGGAEP
jgi:outer membrane murein-binding lipoprotein Lpp